MRMRLRPCLAALAALAVLLSVADAEIGIAGFGDGKGQDIPGTAAVKNDIPYIKCEVCNLVGKHAYRQVKAAEKELKPGKKVSSLTPSIEGSSMT